MFVTNLMDLDIQPIAGTDLWKLQTEVTYYSELLNRIITVPAGYITDLASIPKIAHSFMSPASHEIRAAAILHDYIYQNLVLLFTKREADLILREAMGVVINPAPVWKIYVVYIAVRIGGKGNW